MPRFGARAFGVGMVVVLAILIVVFVSKAVFALFAGLLFALFLKTIADGIARHTPISYRVAVVSLVLLGFGAIVLAVVFVGPQVSEQVQHLAEDLPKAFRTLMNRVRHALQGGGMNVVPTPSELRPEPKSFVADATGAVATSVEALAGIVVAAFVGIYGAISPGDYVKVALVVVPPEKRPRYGQVLHETGRRLGRWLVGRAVAMTFVGVASSIGLALLHVPLALTLGILAGLLAFVEYVGAITSAIPPMLLALTKEPMDAVWVAVLFTGVHIVEGYVLTPLIARTAVHFPPALTLAAQTLFGATFGVIGLTFATPACIVGATFLDMLYVQDTLGERSDEPSKEARKPGELGNVDRGAKEAKEGERIGKA